MLVRITMWKSINVSQKMWIFLNFYEKKVWTYVVPSCMEMVGKEDVCRASWDKYLISGLPMRKTCRHLVILSHNHVLTEATHLSHLCFKMHALFVTNVMLFYMTAWIYFWVLCQWKFALFWIACNFTAFFWSVFLNANTNIV